MSLKIWLPLNGNLENLGMADATFSATNNPTIVNDGKIGKCYQFDGSTTGQRIYCSTYSNTNFNNKPLTICFWFKKLGENTASNAQGLVDLTYGIYSFVQQTTNKIIWYCGTKNLSNIFLLSTFGIENNIWYHIAFVNDGEYAKMYINGELNNSVYIGEYPYTYYNNGMSVGCGLNNTKLWTTNGCFNDVRVYDEALSPKEIKDISKGLILHYNFENTLIPYDNIFITNSMRLYTYNNFTVPCSLSLTGDYYRGAPIYKLSMTPDSSNLSSFRNALWGHGVRTNTVLVGANTKAVCSIMWKPITNSDTIFGGTAQNSPLYWKAGDTVNLDEGWSQYYQYIDGVTNTTYKSDFVYFSFCSPSAKVDIPIELYVCFPTVEFDVLEPARNQIYNVNDNTILYDNSGYGNNGTMALTTSPYPSYESAEGQIGMYFTADSYKRITIPSINLPSDSYTLNTWYKHGTGSFASNRYEMLFYLMNATNSEIIEHYVSVGGTKFGAYFSTNTSTKFSQYYSFDFSDRNWHMLTSSFNGTTWKMYIDGTLVNSGTSSLTLMRGTANGHISTYHNSSSYPIYDSYIDDYRLYATQLSDEDVSLLYKSKANIAKPAAITVGNSNEYSYQDPENLVYNGDLHTGNLSGYNNSRLTLDSSYNALHLPGNWNYTNGLTNMYIPINHNDTYEISFDIMYLSVPTSSMLWCIYPYDANYNFIHYEDVSKTNNSTASQTTLAQDLNYGDISAVLTSSSGWYTGSTNHQRIMGICNNLSYGYDRNANTIYYYPDISNNTLRFSNSTGTADATWPYGTVLAGTPVANFQGGSTYVYPVTIPSGNTLNTWYSYTASLYPVGANSSSHYRYSEAYFKLSILNYSGECLIKNIKLKNKTSYQVIDIPQTITELKTNIDKKSILKSGSINENGIQIRYIRDWLCGSSSNVDNHWVEVQAINIAGENLLFGKTPTSNKNIYEYSNGAYVAYNYIGSYSTDNSTNSASHTENSSSDGASGFLQYDLGYLTNINQLKIWHYYSDGRTYHKTKTEVSVDGINWITVFDSNIEGEYAETSTGHIIDLPNLLYPKYNSDLFSLENLTVTSYRDQYSFPASTTATGNYKILNNASGLYTLIAGKTYTLSIGAIEKVDGAVEETESLVLLQHENGSENAYFLPYSTHKNSITFAVSSNSNARLVLYSTRRYTSGNNNIVKLTNVSLVEGSYKDVVWSQNANLCYACNKGSLYPNLFTQGTATTDSNVAVLNTTNYLVKLCYSKITPIVGNVYSMVYSSRLGKSSGDSQKTRIYPHAYGGAMGIGSAGVNTFVSAFKPIIMAGGFTFPSSTVTQAIKGFGFFQAPSSITDVQSDFNWGILVDGSVDLSKVFAWDDYVYIAPTNEDVYKNITNTKMFKNGSIYADKLIEN